LEILLSSLTQNPLRDLLVKLLLTRSRPNKVGTTASQCQMAGSENRLFYLIIGVEGLWLIGLHTLPGRLFCYRSHWLKCSTSAVPTSFQHNTCRPEVLLLQYTCIEHMAESDAIVPFTVSSALGTIYPNRVFIP
jgi:hypothetical protein